MADSDRSVFDPEFLGLVQTWFSSIDEIFLIARYSRMAGAKDYFWFRRYAAIEAQLSRLPPQTDVIVLRDNQFPLRGVVNDQFVERALHTVADGSEGMITNLVEPPDNEVAIETFETHTEMLELLRQFAGRHASIGLYPPWHRPDSENMISALVPRSDGSLERGAY